MTTNCEPVTQATDPGIHGSRPVPRGFGNDECVGAVVLTGSPVSAGFDSTLATTGTEGQSNAACLFFGQSGIALDEWFIWNGTGTGAATMTVCGATSVDTKIAVYVGSCGGLINIACNDDFCGLQSELSVPVTAGIDYIIQVGTFPGAGGGTGTITISIPGGGGPPNDNCASPHVLVGASGAVATDTTSATNDFPGTCGASAISPDIWYIWTAPATGPVTFSFCPAEGGSAAYDTVLSFHDDCLTTFSCNDDLCTLQSSLVRSVTAGQTMRIRVSGFSGGSGAGVMGWNLAALPPANNDTCAVATPISELCWYEYDNRLATIDGPPDALCGTQIDHDIWYLWTGVCGSAITFETCGGSSLDTHIAVYDNGPSPIPMCPPGPALACNNDLCGLQSRVTFTATPGNSYLLRVGNFNGSPSGLGAFRLSCSGCDIVCQPCEREEDEPCGSDINGGCNASAPGAYEVVVCNERIHGTAWALAGVRDTDWYRVTAPPSGVISATLTSEFNAAFLILDLGTPIPHPCGPVTILASATVMPCIPTTLSASGLVPGQDYVVFVATTTFDGVPCAGDYTIDFDVQTSCPPCCCPDGTSPTPSATYIFEIGGVSGAGDTSFPWTITFPSGPGCVSIGGTVNMPPESCAALSAIEFASSITAESVAAGVAHIIRARAYPGSRGCSEAFLVIDVYGNPSCETCPMVLCVGAPACCIPPNSSCIPAPLSSPSISAVPLLCEDCDNSGTDDRVDLIAGRLTDFNNNGVYDQCEGFIVPSPLGFPISAFNSMLTLGESNRVVFNSPTATPRGLDAFAPGFESFAMALDASLVGAVDGVSDVRVVGTGVLNGVPGQQRGVVRIDVESTVFSSFRAYADFASLNAATVRIELIDILGAVVSTATVPNNPAAALVQFQGGLPEIEIDSVIQTGTPASFITERGAVLRFDTPTTANIALPFFPSFADISEVRLIAEGPSLATLGLIESARLTARQLSSVQVRRMSAGVLDGSRATPDAATTLSVPGPGMGTGLLLEPAAASEVNLYGVTIKQGLCSPTTRFPIAFPVPGLCPFWQIILCGKLPDGIEGEMDPLDLHGRSYSALLAGPGIDIFVPLCTTGFAALCTTSPPDIEYQLVSHGVSTHPRRLGAYSNNGRRLLGSVNAWPTSIREMLIGNRPCVEVFYAAPSSGTLTFNLGDPLGGAGHTGLQSYANTDLYIRFTSNVTTNFLGVTAVKIKASKLPSTTVLSLVPLPEVCSCDTNMDGNRTSQDFFEYLLLFFGNEPGADINMDGFVNTQDFFDYLSCFVNGC